MGNLVILGSVVAATALLARLSEANEELRRARDRVAVLAVNEERAGSPATCTTSSATA